ncbi:MAG TPA: hypothetical protein VE954_07390 [Oligoflexus sp.]|uniref:hypothetical protein n=1 Tax=Oligoflexus sp. TaxID=1971216 RepID=UPI002D345240|nr:hypothetical protein [Oligoflexus sp.]HYX32922.1 hypothetical protein [Oligoflexus sp.]
MGLMRSLIRLVQTVFGLAEGGTERATDTILTSSPEAIRNQFRKTKEDWIRDYDQMKSAVADLCTIRDTRSQEMIQLQKNLDQKMASMKGAIELYKTSHDERLRETYARLAEEKEAMEERVDELEIDIQNQDKLIQTYKDKLRSLQQSIENLKKEESETVAEIVSSRKIAELNSRLEGLAVDTQGRNLDAIREARKKARSVARLSNELTHPPHEELENRIATAGRVSKHLQSFDEAVKLDRIFVEPQGQELLKEPGTAQKQSAHPSIDSLFS